MNKLIPGGLLLSLVLIIACAKEQAPVVESTLAAAAAEQAADTGVEQAFDGAAGLAALEGSEDGQAWLLLGREARLAQDFETAQVALDAAEKTGFSPPSVSFERVRLAVAMEQPETAEDLLDGMIANGFTAVHFLVNDPVVGSLAGRARFDAMVKKLSVAAYPCEHQQGFRDFDFWLGEWIVHTATGQHVGNNVIKSVERGCVITENWTDTAGGTGMSINYLDKTTGEWVQVWNAGSGSQINIRGGLTDDTMAMEGTIYYVASDTSTPFRALWTPLEDGRVRQYFEHSNDGGETWISWFEGFYTRLDKTE